MNQHYLPECYLNEFCNEEGFFFRLDCSLLKHNKLPYPLKTTPSSTCYKPNFYTLTDEFKNAYPMYEHLDPLYLEKKFHEYERIYPVIINKIKTGATSLTTFDAIKFIYSCIDFKIRNFYFRDNALASKRKEKLVKDNYNDFLIDKELQSYIQKNFHVDKNLLDEIIQVEKLKKLNDPDFSKHSHIAAMIARTEAMSSIHDIIISKLLFYKWKFFLSKNKFITSDNPGWSLDKKNVVHNTRFENEFQFLMPITPSYCLCITDHEIDMDYYNDSTQKLLYGGLISNEMIDRVNNLSINHFKQYLFASNYEIADRVSKDIKLRE